MTRLTLKSLLIVFAIGFLAVSMTLAGTTAVTGGAKVYAREVGAVNAVLTLPAGSQMTRSMQVIRQGDQNFFLIVTLGGGLTFNAGGLPVAGDLVQAAPLAPADVISIAEGGTAGTNSVTFLVDTSTNPPLTLPVVYNLDLSGWMLNDPLNVVGTGGTATITAVTNDASTGIPFDGGTDTVNLLSGAYAVVITNALVPTTATIDVAAPSIRTKFVPNAPDTLTTDQGANVGLGIAAPAPLGLNGLAFALVAGAGGDVVTFSFTSSTDFAGVGNGGITWGAFGSTAPTTTTRRIQVGPGGADFPLPAGATPFITTVNGTTQLVPRTLFVQIDLAISAQAGRGPALAAAVRTLQASTILSVWTFNGTILVDNWANGNDEFFLSRCYIWNPSSQAGDVTARVFTLPVNGGTHARVGVDVPLGQLPALSGTNYKVEEILEAAGVTLPYVTDNGNIVIEFTIEASGCRGVGQTFVVTGGVPNPFSAFPMAVIM